LVKVSSKLAVKAAVLALALVAWSGGAEAASFDCKKAKTKAEKLICETAELSKADDELALAYKAAVKAMKDAKELREVQATWRQRRDRCGDAACMLDSYQQRIAELRAMAKPLPRTGIYSRAEGPLGTIEVLELTPGRLRFTVDAYSEAGHGGTVNMGMFCGEVVLAREVGTWTDPADEECKVSLRFQKGRRLEVTQQGVCAEVMGARVSADGSYRADPEKRAPALALCY
jgi:uncharacterized protein